MKKISITSVVLLMAVTAAAAPARRGSADDTDERARRSVPAGSVVVSASRGDFGPFKNGILVIHREEASADCRYAGMALIPQKDRSYRAVNLPDLRQFDNLTVDNAGVGPALFADVDEDGQKEVLIPVRGNRKGPDGYPLMVVAVMDWNGKDFASLEKLENYFGDTCSNAVQVRAMINLLVTCAGTYVSETAGVSADLVIALAQNGELTGTWNAVYGQAHMCDRLAFGIRQGRGRVELVKTGAQSGADEVIGAMQVSGGKAVIRFLKDLGEFDCGAGHPPVVKLKRK